MKFFLLSFFFYFALLAEPLALRFSPKNFDYIFSAQPESITSIPMVMQCMESKYADNPKMQWCKEVGIDFKNMKSFAFTANLSEFIKLKKTRTPEAQVERIRQWLMFIEYKTAPDLMKMEEKYKARKAAGKNRLDFQKSQVAGKTAYIVPVKQRKYCYAQISPTQWVAGEIETVKKVLALSEAGSMLSQSFFQSELNKNADTLMFAVHKPQGKVEIAHPMMQTYTGHFAKVTYDEDFLIEGSLSMSKKEDLLGVESFVKMMSGFMLAKPEMKMSADSLKTSISDSSLDMSLRVSVESLKSMREQMKKKWSHKRHHHNHEKAEKEKK
ncbi:hypothetical protein PQO03_02675 [Lentisphaera profundi]|uniref:DUF4412 domain-containing protein n=1 Tax=Lentisphaera profundi TaxID=1658616 RepID=A0ABY7VUH9_9BACT|nr:hypothetical protein [Lentisphaera profundi]WDE96865.1 hypothetical protein PQO03_02675 [Lentisphaera profundi]